MRDMNRAELEEFLDRITMAGEMKQHDQQAHLIEELAGHAPHILKLLLYILKNPDKERWQPAMLVLGKLGYPNNELGIPVAIYHAGDINSLAHPEALQLLRSLPTDILVQRLVAHTWTSIHSSQQRKWIADEIFAVVFQVSETFPVNQLTPLLVYIVNHRTLLKSIHHPQLLLEVLRLCSENSRIYAIPALADLAENEPNSTLGVLAQAFISEMSPTSLGPYSLIIE